MLINAQGVCLCWGFRRFTFPFADRGSSIGCTVRAVIRMGFLIFQDRRLFNPPALWVQFNTLAADGLNGRCLVLFEKLIDARFDQAHGTLAFLLVVFFQPRAWLLWLFHLLIRS